MLLYVLKLSISLSVIWIFYQLMLRRLTFYNLNRWYLLGYSLLAFMIPLIKIGFFLERDSMEGTAIQYIPVIGGYRNALVTESGFASLFTPLNVLPGILLTGSAVLLVRLLIRWMSLRRVRKQARLISDTGIRIFQVDRPILPFSFGNAIYVNQRLHTEKEYSAIILHEYVHIRQKHTVDILLAELLCIVNWYNPFAWLIRYSIRQNLEFIADRHVLENGFDKKGYQYHLLQVVGAPMYRLANNFNFSSLKKRIIMMNKVKSARLHLVKFLFIVPLLAVLLLAFRDKINPAPAGIPPSHVTTGVPDPLAEMSVETPVPSRKLSSSETGTNRPALTIDRLVTDTVPKKKDTAAKPLYIVDGKVMADGWEAAGMIKPENIEAINIFKDKEAVAQYGQRAKNGVIIITLKKNIIIKDSIRLDGEPLYYIDGVEASPEMKNKLSPNEIQAINVIKGDSAVIKYGEKGRKGVILIETKQHKTTRVGKSMIIHDTKGEVLTMTADSFIIDGKKVDLKQYVVFIDGKRAPEVSSWTSLLNGQETREIACAELGEGITKYGLDGSQTLVNLITAGNKDNPAAYMLGYAGNR